MSTNATPAEQDQQLAHQLVLELLFHGQNGTAPMERCKGLLEEARKIRDDLLAGDPSAPARLREMTQAVISLGEEFPLA